LKLASLALSSRAVCDMQAQLFPDVESAGPESARRPKSDQRYLSAWKVEVQDALATSGPVWNQQVVELYNTESQVSDWPVILSPLHACDSSLVLIRDSSLPAHHAV
jgi:hypothetical protein